MTALIKSIILRPNYVVETSSIDTEIIVDNEGGGYFFTIRQDGLEDWLAADDQVPQIRVDFDEIEELYETLKTLRDEWRNTR